MMGSVAAFGPYSLGTAALGGLYQPVDDDQADELIASAHSHGITTFDTAPQYGHGTAERRLGRALRHVPRASITLCSKVGRLVVPDPDGDTGIFFNAPPSRMQFAFDRDSVLRSIDESLERLGVDRLDVIHIHDPDDHVDEALRVTYPTLHDLRAQGVVSAIGVGMNQSAVPTRFVTDTDIDLVLLAGRYTLLDQSALDDLIPAARARNVGIIIGGVFNSGILAGPDNAPTFNYAAASDDLVARAKALRTVCAQHGVTLKQAALAFVSREPAVVTVLLGARSRDELNELIALDLDAVPDELWSHLRAEGLVRPDAC
jgi:D-threo-aldose 1-dehydrogenase